MKKILFSCQIVIILCTHLHAQSVGIGTAVPQSSSMLDVTSANKGLLVPRIALNGSSDASTITTPATSLLIYNTATASDVTPGYYYWSGNSWLRLATVSSIGTGWLLTGNASTVDGNNFIGTTDNVPFNIKVNNQKAGRIDSATQNTYWGYQSGLKSMGDHNTAMGFHALFSNTFGASGSYNTANGVNALFSNINGGANTAIGNGALFSNTFAFGNTATGLAALYSNTGDYNTANGYQTLSANTTGFSNVAIGTQALYNNVTSSNLVAIGDSALFNNTALKNTAVGSKALYSNTTGSGNTSNGYKALFSNTRGDGNTANGTFALFLDTTGNNNTATGLAALQLNTSGSENTANGYGALLGNTTGNNNTALGLNALYSNTTGNNNTALGLNALYSSTTGNNNIAIGAGSNVIFQNLTNATAIGYNSLVGASNSLVLGSTGTEAVNVGIGISGPLSRLHIVGSNSSNSYVRVDGPVGTVQAIFGLNEGALVGFAGNLTNHNFDIRTNNVARVTIDNTGNFYPAADNTHSCGKSGNRWSAVWSANGVIQTSDMRMKENILSLNYGLKEVLKLHPVSYNWKDKKDKTKKIGIIAQELQQVLPELVVTGDDAQSTLGVNYSELTPVIIKAMQEQQDIIKDQQRQINKLMKGITIQQNNMDELKTRMEKMGKLMVNK